MFKVKALYDYASGHEDDLEFTVGQIITVTDEVDDDWYGGEYVDESGIKHEGIFPRNFVEKYEPTAPPRPTRSRTKKEPEVVPAPAPEAPAAAAPPAPPPDSPKQATPEPEETPKPAGPAPSSETSSAAPPVPAPVAEPPASQPVQPVQPVQAPAPAPAPAPPAPQPAEVPSAASPPAPKSGPSLPKPGGPPPVSEKPTSSSFKDRIAAFNKPAAPPIAPFKPGNLSSSGAAFIKKPFVAPPPSRNAYIPPPSQVPVAKIYRREEDPEVKEQEAEVLENAGKAGLIPTASTNEGQASEDQPKPMSLKERLALLQKQQLETAARHAEAAAKKEKSKRLPKKRLDSQDTVEGESAERTEETTRTSTDEAPPPRVAHPPRRRSSKGTEPRDGNEADMSGAGETTEGQEELTERDDSDGKPKHVASASKQEDSSRDEKEEDEEEEEEEEEEIDPEIRRREELRARMAKMSGGMGMPGMGMPLFGAPAPILPKKKKAVPEKRVEEAEEPTSPTARAPPVPLPGLMRPPPVPEPKQPGPEEEGDEEEKEEDEESQIKTPHQEAAAPPVPLKESDVPPPVPGGRPAPPPVPADSRPPPPPPAASAVKSPSEGSVSDDELSERPLEEPDAPGDGVSQVTRAPPPPPAAAAAAAATTAPPPIPSTPRISDDRRTSYVEEASSPTSPRESATSKRNSRPPPPIPSSPPAIPPAQSRPPPPPPPVPVGRRNSDESEDEEVTEYEGDYDTDIASSVPHKDALKAHQRDSSFEDVMSPRSPTTEAPPPPVPAAAPPRAGPPPVPSQPPRPPTRSSVDAPRVAPPPPPPPKEAPRLDDEYDPYNYTSPQQAAPAAPSYGMPSSPPRLRQQEEMFTQEASHSQHPRSPPPPPPTGRAPGRQSVDYQRHGVGRRSVDVTRPSMESGFVADDIDLAKSSSWWLQPNGLPPQLHGRKDIFFESEESSSADPHQGGKTIVTRDIYVLFQDYSQTVITVRFSPQDPSDVHLEQRHEPPPRALRQDQLEQSYERFGRAIGEAAASKKDTVVGDGTPQALVFELLRPFKDALLPVGARAYGALVYSNLANASTTQNDEIRPGDIVSIRNAKFQGKHGAMHAKYSMEVGKPDHVAVVAEWDGTKKKVKAWEQGRESKKVKLESFRLDDLRSGEVKIWRVMARSWIGWESNTGAGGAGN